MAVTLDIPFKASIKSARSPADTLAYLTNWKASLGGAFPGVRAFREVEPGIYAWEFEEVGYQSFKLKIAFQTRMQASPPDKASVTPHSGAHRLSLQWNVQPEGTGSRAALDLNFTVELPVPGLMKGLVAGFARTELTKLLERYAANVEKALSA
jgi:hypothetical protein